MWIDARLLLREDSSRKLPLRLPCRCVFSHVNVLIVLLARQTHSHPRAFTVFPLLSSSETLLPICLLGLALTSFRSLCKCQYIVRRELRDKSIRNSIPMLSMPLLCFIFFHLIYLFYINLLNFFLHRYLESVRMWNLCLSAIYSTSNEWSFGCEN